MTIMRGLPASGKSTLARAIEASDPDVWTRVNKDDIRERLGLGPDSGRWNKHREKSEVEPERDRLITEALVAGRSVIVDDTNLEDRHLRRLYELANVFGVRVEIKTMDVDVEDAIERDSRRARPVGEAVIRDMARRYYGEPWRLEQYAHTPGLRWAIICDLDGTLALFCKEHGCACELNHRSPYNASTAHLDVPNRPVRHMLKRFSGDTDIIFVSGRESLYRDQTVEFIEGPAAIKDYTLHMRRTGDSRKDAVVKAEIFDAHIRGKYNIRFVLDDRNQVVQLWRSLGLTCLQVADGDF